MLCICWIGQYVSGKVLKVDGKMFPDLSGFLSAIYVHIHFRYQKGRPRAITYFSNYISHAETKSKYGFKNQKAKQGLTLMITVILYQQPVPNPGLLLTVWSLFAML